MYCGSLVFSSIAASRLLLGDDQVAGGNNSCIVGSRRSVREKFSSTGARGRAVSFTGAGSGFVSFSISCCFGTSVGSFGVLADLGVTALASGELFLAMVAGCLESRVGRSDGSLEGCFAA